MSKQVHSFYLISFLIIVSQVNLWATTSSDTLDYNFWIGDWEVSWSEGEGKIGSGINHIMSILDERVIQENFEITKGQSKGFKGSSMSVYNPQSKLWKQAWTDNQGGYYDFTGGVDALGNPIFSTAIVKKGDEEKISRMVFKNITKDSLIWDWEGSTDGGINWSLMWRINYKRMPNNQQQLTSDAYKLLMGKSQCQSERMGNDGSWQKPVDMTWIFEPIMNGGGIQDKFSMANGLEGGSIRQYNQKDDEWYVHYYSSVATPTLQSWKGRQKNDGESILYSAQKSPSGEAGFLKLKFYDITDSGYKWLGAWVNEDETKSSPFWRISCKRD